MLLLSEIWIYPIKSMGGISLNQAQLTDRGLAHDRRWMLVDAQNRFVSQREYPQLALFQTAIKEQFLNVKYRITGESVEFPLVSTYNDASLLVSVWDDLVAAYEVKPEVSQWFSNILNFEVKLVYMPDESLRKVEPDYAVTSTDLTSLSDGYPFLIIGQNSLDELNRRLENPVPMNRFRPNFVFTGGTANEEETWKEFTIGQEFFYGVKPCARCVMTTVDQDKGMVSGSDPLRTLAEYRRVGNKVLFGQNLISTTLGQVAIGDQITIQLKNRS